MKILTGSVILTSRLYSQIADNASDNVEQLLTGIAALLSRHEHGY
jgi:hypothetical protein